MTEHATLDSHPLPEGAVRGKPGLVLSDLVRDHHELRAPSGFLSKIVLAAPDAAYDPDDWGTPPRETEYIVADPAALKELRTPYERNHVLNVFSLQRVLQTIGVDIIPDGVFGTATRTAVVRYQRNRGLYPDGIAGPKTQSRMVLGFVWQEEDQNALPSRLLEGQSLAEAGLLFTAVNWSSGGGVDCSATQRRVYEPFDPAALRRAFDVRYQVDLSGKRFRDLHDRFLPRAGTQSKTGPISYIPTPNERAWRLAALDHNYPSAADRYSRFEQHTSSYWTTHQTWVTEAGFTFEDGAPVATPFEWAQNYALGSPDHGDKGNVCALVSSWD